MKPDKKKKRKGFKFKTAKPTKKKDRLCQQLAKNLPAEPMGKQARSEQHELFCVAYAAKQNAAAAARAAGYSEKSARAIGYELLTYPHIKLRVTALINERKNKLALEGDEILKATSTLARSDLRDLLDENGCVLPAHEWPDHIAVCVASMKVKELIHPLTGVKYGRVVEVRLWDKMKGQELMGKNKKLWTDSLEAKVGPLTSADPEQVKQEVKKLEEDV